jgi:hypothetical protein
MNMPPIAATALEVRTPQMDYSTQWSQVTSVFDQALWSRSANRKLEELLALEDGWDRFGSPKVSGQIANIARNVLVDLAKLKMPEPKILPVPGGGLQLEWGNSRRELEIEILPNSTIEYLVTDAEGNMEEGNIDSRDGITEFSALAAWFCSEGKADEFAIEYAPTQRR